MNPDLAALRRTYALQNLTEDQAGDCPLQLFQKWLQDALTSETLDPNAMTLATVDASGQPKARILLLKDFSPQKGWVFYTNYASDKGQELAANPNCSLLFWWEKLQRQVRVEGRVSRVPEAESTAYFHSRPRDSQLGAWASQQSQVIDSREVLQQRMASISQQYSADREIPRPEHWGGYQLQAHCVEFWQGQPSRLHDRLRFTCTDHGWLRERLSP